MSSTRSALGRPLLALALLVPVAAASAPAIKRIPDEAPRPSAPLVSRAPSLPIDESLKFYDTLSPAFDRLQAPGRALADFPTDRFGFVDWVQALEQGLIQPRAERGAQGSMEVLDQDVLMTDTRDMAFVRFPHKPHTQWLACENCHDRIFKAEAGANDINMERILAGEYCGVCHDRVSFSFADCERCHSVPAAAVSGP